MITSNFLVWLSYRHIESLTYLHYKHIYFYHFIYVTVRYILNESKTSRELVITVRSIIFISFFLQQKWSFGFNFIRSLVRKQQKIDVAGHTTRHNTCCVWKREIITQWLWSYPSEAKGLRNIILCIGFISQTPTNQKLVFFLLYILSILARILRDPNLSNLYMARQSHLIQNPSSCFDANGIQMDPELSKIKHFKSQSKCLHITFFWKNNILFWDKNVT